MRPLIGIPQCLDDQGRWRAGRDYQYIDANYARAVAAAGGTPIYLPIQPDATSLVARLDGLILPGGDDLAPPTEPPYPDDVVFELAPGNQLDFDRRLLRAALRRGLPTLAICYGMQVLALELGGALHYHLPVDVPHASPHQLHESQGRHGLEVVPDSRLKALLGSGPGLVNSLHHQGVADPGARLQVSARAPDGVIEAIELPESPFCLGVQWHPEKLEGENGAPLFRALVAAASGANDG
ncbi:gamma-glutamyl-gamma-aminobutyrate hydrolase family protein [Myxococcota bacterium]|nr:gamma-glutamyl-gamma-aminobutyrate hydrolase family protein [Myxococcota bacterium]